MTTHDEWEHDHQTFEKDWWGNCVNTFGEEAKQISYMYRMGLPVKPTNDGKWPAYDLEGKSVLDIGGGPVSMLLKSINARGFVVDPCDYPEWVYERYRANNITYVRLAAEHFTEDKHAPFDEVWIYNVLQHTMDPEQIIKNARNLGKKIRIFEWVDTPASPGHPQVLTAEKLDLWLHTRGTVENINENGAVGRCYYATVEVQ